MRINKLQAKSLKRKWEQDSQGMTYLQFRRSIEPGFGYDFIVVRWCSMYLAIEVDGYCHS